MSVLRRKAFDTAGLRAEKCTQATVTRPGQDPKATGHIQGQLSALQHAPPGSCRKVLGAYTQLDAGHRE